MRKEWGVVLLLNPIAIFLKIIFMAFSGFFDNLMQALEHASLAFLLSHSRKEES